MVTLTCNNIVTKLYTRCKGPGAGNLGSVREEGTYPQTGPQKQKPLIMNLREVPIKCSVA